MSEEQTQEQTQHLGSHSVYVSGTGEVRMEPGFEMSEGMWLVVEGMMLDWLAIPPETRVEIEMHVGTQGDPESPHVIGYSLVIVDEVDEATWAALEPARQLALTTDTVVPEA